MFWVLEVTGSNPVIPNLDDIVKTLLVQQVERRFPKPNVMGSNPIKRDKHYNRNTTMVRIRRGKITKHKRNKILQQTRGYRGKNHRLYRMASQRNLRALTTMYIHRKHQKRVYRKLWISRINSIARLYTTNYSQLMNQQIHKQHLLNRKILTQLSLYEKNTFINSLI